MSRKARVAIGPVDVEIVTSDAGLTGDPVVFVHGILGSPRFWELLIPDDLQSTARWLSISLPGHVTDGHKISLGVRGHDRSTSHHYIRGTARMDEPEPIWTEDALAEWMLSAIDSQLHGGCFSLVGWSTGGFAALNLARRFPERVHRVLSISGFASGRWHGMLGWLQRCCRKGAAGRWSCRSILKRMQQSRTIFSLLHSWNAQDWRAFRVNPIARQAMNTLFEDFRRYNLAALADMIWASRTWNITTSLANIRCPVTMASGASDPIIPWRHAEEIAGTIPHCRLIRWDGCGHMFFGERTAEFQSLLRLWWLTYQNETREIIRPCTVA